jgi:hypothetical protein
MEKGLLTAYLFVNEKVTYKSDFYQLTVAMNDP